MDCSPPGSSIHEVSQVRMLEWIAISTSKGSSQPRDWTWVFCISQQVLYHWATKEAQGKRITHQQIPWKKWECMCLWERSRKKVTKSGTGKNGWHRWIRTLNHRGYRGHVSSTHIQHQGAPLLPGCYYYFWGHKLRWTRGNGFYFLSTEGFIQGNKVYKNSRERESTAS